MQVRTLSEADKPLFAEFVRDAFVVVGDFKDFWLKHMDAQDMRGLFDDDGTLLTAIRFWRNDLWLGRRRVKMAGLTNVATPPENRRKGLVRQLLTESLRQERESGVNVSGLYPFEFPFYAMFGYAQASVSAEHTVKIGALLNFKSRTKGRWTKAVADDWQIFRDLYDKFCVGRFGRNSRDTEYWWRFRLFLHRRNSGDTPNNVYLWRDENGTARAYVIYDFKSLGGDWDREMVVQDMVWLDEAARHEIYAFIGNHDSQAIQVFWQGEPGDEFFARLPDPRQAQIRLEPGYMIRLLDVERALTERAYPLEAKGNLSFGVQDKLFEWNANRTFRLAVEGGEAAVNVAPGAADPDFSCDVATLGQIYAGYLSPLTAARLGTLAVHNEKALATAQGIFSPPGQPASFMLDHW
jgi:predicted acetyltransferase